MNDRLPVLAMDQVHSAASAKTLHTSTFRMVFLFLRFPLSVLSYFALRSANTPFCSTLKIPPLFLAITRLRFRIHSFSHSMALFLISGEGSVEGRRIRQERGGKVKLYLLLSRRHRIDTTESNTEYHERKKLLSSALRYNVIVVVGDDVKHLPFDLIPPSFAQAASDSTPNQQPAGRP